MKKLILGGLSALALSSAVAKAEYTLPNVPTPARTDLMCVSNVDYFGRPSALNGTVPLTFTIVVPPYGYQARTYYVPANTAYYAPGAFVGCPVGYYENFPVGNAIPY